MASPISTGVIKVAGTSARVDIYGYTDPETGKEYRSIFLDEVVDKIPGVVMAGDLPQSASVTYQGNRYRAEKFKNPNNQVPTYDFVLKSSQ